VALSNIQQNLVPTEPHLIDLLNLFKKQIFLDFNSHHLGTIQSFNALTQTASASINYPKTFFNFNTTTGVYETTVQNYSVITEAPVIILGGGEGAITFPIAAGDECLIFFNDRDLDNWFVGGAGSPCATARLHSFSDALILVGISSLANVYLNYDTTRVVLRNGVTGTTLVGVSATQIKIANATTTLNTLLQSLITDLTNLCTALESLTVICAAPGDASSPPVNVAAITAVATSLTSLSTQIGGLLE
jgi:hypothetical protein